MQAPRFLTRVTKKAKIDSLPLRMVGVVLLTEAILMVLCFTGFSVPEELHTAIFFMTMFGFVGGAVLMYLTSGANFDGVSPHQGILTINLIWIVAIVYGCTPYVISGFNIPAALFESISGFTTTGASIIPDLESLSDALLVWRAATGWAGGLGFIMFFCLLLKYFGLGGKNLFVSGGIDRSEFRSTGFVKKYAISFVVVYVLLTVVLAIALVLLGNDGIDSLCISMSTISTTGFSTLNEDIAYMSMASKVLIGGFLLLSAMNFITLFGSLTKKTLRHVHEDSEVKTMLIWFAVFTVILFGVLLRYGMVDYELESIVDTVLMVISFGTTTGFVFNDFTWPTLAMLIMCLLALIGGCRESPTGGIKIARLSLIFRSVRNNIVQVAFPNEVRDVKYGNRYMSEEGCQAAMTTLMMFLITLALGTVAIIISGVNVLDSFYLAVSSITTTGTGIYSIADVSSIPKMAQNIMCLLMWLGRMEVVLALAVLTPSFWSNVYKPLTGSYTRIRNRLRFKRTSRDKRQES